MKGFIKVTNVDKEIGYVNIHHVLRFYRSSPDYAGKAFLFVEDTQNTTVIQTLETVEDIVALIEMAQE